MRGWRAAVLLAAVATAACEPSLKEVAVNMDSSAPKYGTAECQGARQKAIAFTDSEPGKLALSAGVGLVPLVGPAASLMLDRDAAKQAQSIMDELRATCGEDSFLPLMQEEAQKGKADAQAWLAQAYDLGYGVQKDPAQAVHWYTLAAAQENTAAEVNLGAHYAKGLGVPQNDAQAAVLWRHAADDDVPEAQTNLAMFYREGKGVPKDLVKARRLYHDAAVEGHASAQLALAEMYENGEGVPKNDAAAYRWYTIASRYGAPGADAKGAAAAVRLSDQDKAAANQQIGQCTYTRLHDCP